PKPTNAFEAEYKGDTNARYSALLWGAAYQASGLPVFGGDYPVPLSDSAKTLPSFEYYSTRGWVPTVAPVHPAYEILTTGPFMYLAKPGNPAVTGSTNFVNYMSGGLLSEASLTGGNLADIIVGGPGRNTIAAGAGNDTIYAHPARAGQRNMLRVVLSQTNTNMPGAATSVVLRVNEQVVAGPTAITAVSGSSTQEFLIDVSAFGAGFTLAIDNSGAIYLDEQHWLHTVVESISLFGETVPLSTGTFENGNSQPHYTFTNNGRVTYGPSSFASLRSYPTDNRSTIDGGTGVNKVVYRGNYASYGITRPDGIAWNVSATATAEGPDTLTNIQKFEFKDLTADLTAPAIAASRIFAFAAGNYPSLFTGNLVTGQYEQFTYAYFPATDNYLAVDLLGGIWMLGNDTGGALVFIAMASTFTSVIVEWEGSSTALREPSALASTRSATALLRRRRPVLPAVAGT
ncbi:MAG TPA: hypothetical protein VK968_04550, partial [Roseimicrobium sp.]|nr:hypothetical protein [Roseimicrobium sp.]